MLFFSLFFFIGAIYIVRIPFKKELKEGLKGNHGFPLEGLKGPRVLSLKPWFPLEGLKEPRGLMGSALEGYDNRNIAENVTDISIIRAHFIKKNLISRLKDDSISDQEKVKMIYNSELVDGLNPNILRGPKPMRGLIW